MSSIRNYYIITGFLGLMEFNLPATAIFQTNCDYHRQFAIPGTIVFRTLQEQTLSNLNP